jgi:hypothetical protein
MIIKVNKDHSQLKVDYININIIYKNKIKKLYLI